MVIEAVLGIIEWVATSSVKWKSVSINCAFHEMLTREPIVMFLCAKIVVRWPISTLPPNESTPQRSTPIFAPVRIATGPPIITTPLFAHFVGYLASSMNTLKTPNESRFGLIGHMNFITPNLLIFTPPPIKIGSFMASFSFKYLKLYHNVFNTLILRIMRILVMFSMKKQL